MEEAAERLASVDACLAASPEHGSVTAGLAALRPEESLAELIARADEALYQRRHDKGVVDLSGRRALSASVAEPSTTP
jgi:PleD family two-component response regulator